MMLTRADTYDAAYDAFRWGVAGEVLRRELRERQKNG